jgi:hypothetical protein
VYIYILIGERIPAIPAPRALQGLVLCHHVSACVCCRYGSVILRVWPCFLVAVVRPASHAVCQKKEKKSSLQASPQLQLRSLSPPPQEQRGWPHHWRPRRRFLIRLPLPRLLSLVLLPLLTLALCSVCLSCGTAFLAIHLGFHCRRPSFLSGF